MRSISLDADLTMVFLSLHPWLIFANLVVLVDWVSVQVEVRPRDVGGDDCFFVAVTQTRTSIEPWEQCNSEYIKQ